MRSILPAKPVHAVPSNSHLMFVFECDIVEIKNNIDNLENKFSSGVDRIKNNFLKVTKDITSADIYHLVSQYLKKAVFPEVLKLAKAFPMHKSDPKTDENNHWPISLLPVGVKCFKV